MPIDVLELSLWMSVIGRVDIVLHHVMTRPFCVTEGWLSGIVWIFLLCQIPLVLSVGRKITIDNGAPFS